MSNLPNPLTVATLRRNQSGTAFDKLHGCLEGLNAQALTQLAMAEASLGTENAVTDFSGVYAIHQERIYDVSSETVPGASYPTRSLLSLARQVNLMKDDSLQRSKLPQGTAVCISLLYLPSLTLSIPLILPPIDPTVSRRSLATALAAGAALGREAPINQVVAYSQWEVGSQHERMSRLDTIQNDLETASEILATHADASLDVGASLVAIAGTLNSAGLL